MRAALGSTPPRWDEVAVDDEGLGAPRHRRRLIARQESVTEGGPQLVVSDEAGPTSPDNRSGLERARSGPVAPVPRPGSGPPRRSGRRGGVGSRPCRSPGPGSRWRERPARSPEPRRRRVRTRSPGPCRRSPGRAAAIARCLPRGSASMIAAAPARRGPSASGRPRGARRRVLEDAPGLGHGADHVVRSADQDASQTESAASRRPDFRPYSRPLGIGSRDRCRVPEFTAAEEREHSRLNRTYMINSGRWHRRNNRHSSDVRGIMATVRSSPGDRAWTAVESALARSWDGSPARPRRGAALAGLERAAARSPPAPGSSARTRPPARLSPRGLACCYKLLPDGGRR